MGYQDLDLRPPEMQRSTMDHWVVDCPKCHCAQHPKGQIKFDLKFIKSGEYSSLIHALVPELANRFQRLAVGLQHQGEEHKAAHAYTCAAWDCDDCDFDKEASVFRSRAADLYLSGAYTAEIESLVSSAICVDLLRRSGQYYRGADLAEQVLERIEKPADEDEEVLQKVLIFGKEKCQQQDAACYTVGDALGVKLEERRDDLPEEEPPF
jgi:hypothetical protein